MVAAAAALSLLGPRLLPGAQRTQAAHQPPVAGLPAPSGPGGAIAAGVNDALTRTFGPGKAYVAINAVVDRNAATSTALGYSRRGVALAQQGAAASAGGYSARSSAVSWGHDTTITRTAMAAGSIRNVQVALLVDTRLPKQTVAAVRSMVAAATGLTPARGDRLSVARVRFPPQPARAAAAASALEPLRSDALRYGPFALLALGVCGFAAAALRERESAALV